MLLKRLLRKNDAAYFAVRGVLMRFRGLVKGCKFLHPTSYVAANCFVHPSLALGPYSFVNSGCHIESGVSIGAYTMLARNVTIIQSDHQFELPGTPTIFAGRTPVKETTIEDDVWIGAGATIIAGVSIARGAVIASGAVVVRDIPAYEIWGGVPAKKIRDRFNSEEIAIHDSVLDQPPAQGTYTNPH